MATLPIMQAGMPDMSMNMAQSDALPPQDIQQGVPDINSMLSDTQPAPIDPQSQSIDALLSTLTPVLDSRASDDLLDEMETGLTNNTYNPKSLTDKAVKKSFTLGIKDLSDLLSKGQHSDEYFGRSGSNSLNSAADAYKALASFMKSTNPAKQSAAITDFRTSLKDLTNISHRLVRITDRNKQSHFLQDMQASNDTVVNQIIGDATSQTDNGSAAFEYLITGQVARGTPLPMIQNQATQLWQAISKTLADNINNQLIALFQQSVAGMLRTEAISSSMQPDGFIDQSVIGQSIMDGIQSTQNRVAQIQQVVDATFSAGLEAKIQQPQEHPVSKLALKHFTA